MQYAKNGSSVHFCHFSYCIQFPKYAIMPIVKSKNNAHVPPFLGKKPWFGTVHLLILLFFSATKMPFRMRKWQ